MYWFYLTESILTDALEPLTIFVLGKSVTVIKAITMFLCTVNLCNMEIASVL